MTPSSSVVVVGCPSLAARHLLSLCFTPSLPQGEKIRWKILWTEKKKWNETKKPNQNKNRYISYQNRLDLGKINLFCCQLKQIWLVRNKDRIKQYLPLVPPPFFFFPGSTSHLHSWLSLEEQKKNLFLSHLFLCLVDNPRDEKIFMCYYLSNIMFSSLTWVSIGLPNQRNALHFILSNIFLVINLDFL